METPSKSNSHSRPFCSLSESVPVWEKGRPLLKQKVRRFISKNRNVRAVSPHVPNYLVPDCFLIQKVSLEVADSCIFQMDQQTTDFRRYNGSTLSESWFPMSFRPTLSQSEKASLRSSIPRSRRSRRSRGSKGSDLFQPHIQIDTLHQ